MSPEPGRFDDGLQDVPSPDALSAAARIAARFGEAAIAILHYGSRAQGRVTRADSAFVQEGGHEWLFLQLRALAGCPP